MFRQIGHFNPGDCSSIKLVQNKDKRLIFEPNDFQILIYPLFMFGFLCRKQLFPEIVVLL